MCTPDRTTVEQSAPGQPWALVVRIAVQPGLTCVEVVVKQFACATDMGAGSLQVRDLGAEPVGGYPVIILPVSDKVTSTHLDAKVALLPTGMRA